MTNVLSNHLKPISMEHENKIQQGEHNPESEAVKDMPSYRVVFFTRKDRQYVTSNGIRITVDFLLKRQHAMYDDSGYVVIEPIHPKTISVTVRQLVELWLMACSSGIASTSVQEDGANMKKYLQTKFNINLEEIK